MQSTLLISPGEDVSTIVSVDNRCPDAASIADSSSVKSPSDWRLTSGCRVLPRRRRCLSVSTGAVPLTPRGSLPARRRRDRRADLGSSLRCLSSSANTVVNHTQTSLSYRPNYYYICVLDNLALSIVYI